MADGSVPGLLACAAASAGGDGNLALWTRPGPDELGRARHQAALRHAEIYGVRPVLGAGVLPPDASENHATSATVLEAAYDAVREHLGTVLWPITAGEPVEDGPDLERIARAVDRALLVGRLVSLDAGGDGRGSVSVRTPYADLTDRQIADLVLDMDLPIWTCWWAIPNAAPELAEAALRERDYWKRMLTLAGWKGDLPGPECAPIIVAKTGHPASIPPSA